MKRRAPYDPKISEKSLLRTALISSATIIALVLFVPVLIYASAYAIGRGTLAIYTVTFAYVIYEPFAIHRALTRLTDTLPYDRTTSTIMFAVLIWLIITPAACICSMRLFGQSGECVAYGLSDRIKSENLGPELRTWAQAIAAKHPGDYDHILPREIPAGVRHLMSNDCFGTISRESNSSLVFVQLYDFRGLYMDIDCFSTKLDALNEPVFRVPYPGISVGYSDDDR